MKSSDFFRNQIVAVFRFHRGDIAAKRTRAGNHVLQWHALFVAEQIRRIVIVRVMLIEVTIEIIEPLPGGHAHRAFAPQAPFAAQTRGIAGRFQHRGHGRVVRLQFIFIVPPHAAVAGVQPGHQRAARWRTHRAAGVELSEPHAAGGQAIDVRRFDLLLAIAAQIAVAEIIGQEEHDVRMRRGAGRFLRLIGHRKTGDGTQNDEEMAFQTICDSQACHDFEPTVGMKIGVRRAGHPSINHSRVDGKELSSSDGNAIIRPFHSLSN